MPVIISVEGNIGSGKSSLVKQMKNNLPSCLFGKPILFLQEPVDEWGKIKNSEGTTILEKFYLDKSKWAFSFQMMAYITRLKSIRDLIKMNGNDVIIICERSLWTDKNVFAKMLYDGGDINDIEYQIYNKWFDEFTTEIPLMGIIYLDTDPEICHDRIQKRSRTGEKVIEIQYLETCYKYHNDWIIDDNPSSKILQLNGNGGDSNNITDKWVTKIKSYIEKLVIETNDVNIRNNEFISKAESGINIEETFDKMWC